MSDARTRLFSLYNGDAYSETTNPGGLDNNGHTKNFVPALRDVATVGGEVADNATLAASAADRQQAWGPAWSANMGTVTYVSATRCTVDTTGTDLAVGTHVQADCGADGYVFGVVSGASEAGGITTVDFSWFSGALTSNLKSITTIDDSRLVYVVDMETPVAAAAASAATAAVARADAVAAKTDAQTAATQAVAAANAFPAIRDTLGRFPGIITPTLNLHCASMTDDTVPLGTLTRSAAATRRGPTGLIESVASGLLRREWDSDGTLLGWLIEEPRTNYIANKAMSDTSTWTDPLNNISRVGGQADVMGGTTGTTISWLTDTWSPLRSSITLTADTAYICCSAFIRDASGLPLKLLCSDTATWTEQSIIFDPTTGIISSPVRVPYYGVYRYASGNYRVWFSFQNTSKSAFALDLTPMTYGKTAVVFGAQVERGAFPTSYIPTATGSVTRPADVWTIPMTAFAFNPREGTFFINADRLTAISNYTRFYEAYDGTGANATSLVVDPSGALYSSVYANSTQYSDWNPFTGYTGGRTNLAHAYNTNDLGFAKDGVAKASDTTASVMPANLTNIGVGRDAANGNFINGHISHFSYFTRRLTNAQLQLITA